jgi:hypothetical protein
MMSTTKASAEPLILFLHVPKTGGTTLQRIIGRQYPSDAICMIRRPTPRTPAELRERSRTFSPHAAVIQGHMPFGLHELLARRATYITLLRNPIDRVISDYYFILSRPVHSLHETLHSESISLVEFASMGRFPGVDNLQTRLLSGRGMSPKACTTDILDEAKRNLREHFSVVGLTERFDETLILLKRLFRWRFVLYVRRNVIRDRPDTRSVDEHTLRAIESSNQLDIELYHYARAMFEEGISRQGLDFDIELEAFRRINRQYAARPASLRI